MAARTICMNTYKKSNTVKPTIKNSKNINLDKSKLASFTCILCTL